MDKEIINFVREKLAPTDHVIFIYHDLQEKREILFIFLKAALDRDEDAVYIASEETPDQIRDAMKNFGLDVEKLEEEGSLKVLNYDGVYLIDGKPDIAHTSNLWRKIVDEARKRGRKGVRLTGETACWFEQGLTEELVEYEKSLHRKFEIPLIAICAYNFKTLEKARGEVVMDLIRAHGYSIDSRSTPTVTKIYG
ncbi:MAG: MEDS domain-containing protein [Candidatus Geothermarchaeales archaeon]